MSVSISRWWWPVFSNFTPAGAAAMTFRPNSIVTGLFTVAPSFGLMMYTSAPAGEAVRSWAQAKVATDARATAAMATARMLFSGWFPMKAAGAYASVSRLYTLVATAIAMTN